MQNITKEDLKTRITSVAGGEYKDNLGCYVIFSTGDESFKLSLNQNFGIVSTENETYNENILNFVNGYARVLLSNGKYGYVNEKTLKLMSYSFDVAFDFNELGFAIVGAKKLGYINKWDLENLNANELSKKLKYDEIEEFKKIRNVYISKVIMNGFYDGKHVSFLDKTGEKIKFIRMLCNSNDRKKEETEFIYYNEENKFNWNDDGVLYNELAGELLFIEGYYTTTKDFILHYYNNNQIPNFNSLITRINKPKQKILIKQKNNE